MPRHNRFRHQSYTSQPPTSTYRLTRAEPAFETDMPPPRERLRAAGRILRRCNVRAVLLLHGTFAGTDATGLIDLLAYFYPDRAEKLRDYEKATVDRVVGWHGNYTQHFAQWLAEGINEEGDGGRPIPVELFHWSSQNNHLARADGAVQLLSELFRLADARADDPPPQPRILIWGHSHAGNLLALLTNLLGGDAESRQRFFETVRPYYETYFRRKIDLPHWHRVYKRLDDLEHPLGDLALDLVTFGTPVRYGWETDGYANLLHFVFHRPAEGLPDYLVPFPPSADEVFHAARGDFIQQIAVAGTDLPPNLLSLHGMAANRRLKRLLQAGLRDRDVLDRLKKGQRVADEGTTLLVDYGPTQETLLEHMAGHAVYTYPEYLPFHLEQIVGRFYAEGEN